jgi:hypothetical protein
MNIVLSDPSAATLAPVNRGRLRRRILFVTVLGLGIIAATARPQNVESVLGAASIVLSTAVPIWLWATGRVKGLPLFPVYAATFVPTFAFPLLYAHPTVMLFSPDDQLIAAFTVAGFLLIATLAWWQVGTLRSRRHDSCLVLNVATADIFFLCALGVDTLLSVATVGNWITFPEGIETIAHSVASSLAALACFVLSFRYGAGEMRAEYRILFGILFSALLISTLPGLLLINAMSLIVVAALGYTLGAQRIPWRGALAALALFAFLQAGKASMREMFWGENESPVLQPLQYPGFIWRWIQNSGVEWTSSGSHDMEHLSLLDRASLMQLLLYIQAMTPNNVPFLDGETYAVVPGLLVPRFLNPDKGASHEGTRLLNIHYGFQSRDETERTTIGFGLLNEAYANFGFAGIGGLAVILGAFYAQVARWARGVPVLSFRVLFAVIIASFAFQTEYSAGVYTAALFQAMVSLAAVAFFFMRRENVRGDARSIID